MSKWAITPPLTPAEAKVRTTFPQPPGWAYEPKWDGFRAVAWGGPDPRLDSRNHRPLLRYFPELEEPLAALRDRAVIDAEIVVVLGDVTNFDALQLRIHPASSRIRMLATETPAELVAFDLLALGDEDLRTSPFRDRRRRLHEFVGEPKPPWHLTPTTEDLDEAKKWFETFEQAGCDGIVAKNLDLSYREGKRDMVKIKHRRTADAVVGGYRLHKEGDRVGSLLLGMYDTEGSLHFIGHCSGFSDEDRVRLLELFSELATDASFGEDARQPGAPSRWSSDRDAAFIAVEPRIVVEVSYDQITGGRFRHATRFERWRPDKDASACTLDQIERPTGVGFSEVVA
ncbi:MAG: ATP-dependent DNA ligase [Acidimicrobiia bacterium]